MEWKYIFINYYMYMAGNTHRILYVVLRVPRGNADAACVCVPTNTSRAQQVRSRWISRPHKQKRGNFDQLAGAGISLSRHLISAPVYVFTKLFQSRAVQY